MSAIVARKALLIGNATYADERFDELPSVLADLHGMEQVLRHREIGQFDTVDVAENLTASDMHKAIGDFFNQCDRTDLAFLYFSGHGVRRGELGGEFHFMGSDSSFDQPTATGVAAKHVNDALEMCIAPQKVVMIDACRSGGFTMGLRTKGVAQLSTPTETLPSGEHSPVAGRGAYVLSSSRAGENSFAAIAAGDEVRASDFTAEVIDGLRTGRIGKNTTGDVSVDDLFDYVNSRMRGRQRPVKSAVGVDDRIVLARCPLGAAPTFEALRRGQMSKPPAPDRGGSGESPATAASWPTFIDFYRRCIAADNAAPDLIRVADTASYVCLRGSERFLAGDLDADNQVEVPPEAADLVASAVASQSELWAGYAAVVVSDSAAGSSRQTVPRFAPLLVRRVEVVEDGGMRLRAYGAAFPHPGLARHQLSAEEAADLASTYQPSWHHGQHDRMAVDAKSLLADVYGLGFVEEPRPHRLAEHIDIRTPTDGARNVAVLLAVPTERAATKRLADDLNEITTKADKLEGTALGATSLARSGGNGALRRTAAERDVCLVTPLPCNDAQERVLRSAMTQPLTVATGPPGTGKSQLVANLVATAVAAGEKVLVASTNNDAVDEVWRRCEALTPGSLVRTGSRGRPAEGKRDYTVAEKETLRALLRVAEPDISIETARARVSFAHTQVAKAKEALGVVARAERGLRRAGEARREFAARLELADGGQALLVDRSLTPMGNRARVLAQARIFGVWRRGRLLRSLDLGSGDDGGVGNCQALAGLVEAEQRWQAERSRLEAAPSDADLAADLSAAEADLASASKVCLDVAVRSRAISGRGSIDTLLSSLGTTREWSRRRGVGGAVGGWAVTSLSARKFPPDQGLFDLVVVDEASQCAIPHVLPLLFRAKRALIIGDPMQLTHITTIGGEAERAISRQAGLGSTLLDEQRMSYRRYSAFQFTERAAGSTHLLDQHFRCHPEIATISNELFYGGRLTVLTDVRGRPALAGRAAVTLLDVKGRAGRGRGGTSWRNLDEVDRVSDLVRELLDELPDASIGVVTPFTGQVAELKARLGENERVRIGTVHTFQGGERDVMVFSLVAAQGMQRRAIDWINGQPNLWNVAITRAKSHLVVVGDIDLWRSAGGVGEDLVVAVGRKATAGPAADDPMRNRLLAILLTSTDRPAIPLDRVNAYTTDAVIRDHDGEATAYLLDPAAAEDVDEASHLRLILDRTRLLGDDLRPAVRVPAWRLDEGFVSVRLPGSPGWPG